MIKLDQQGQISIEFVLVIALIAVIVISIGLYVSDVSEQSIISSAVRSAADNATTTIVLLNRSMAPISVQNINSISNGTNITLQVNISGSFTNQTSTILISSILNSIATQGYNVTNTSIVTNRHIYTIQVI